VLFPLFAILPFRYFAILYFCLMSFPLHRNLIALYIIRVAKWLNLVMPVVVLFYQSNGLTMQDIFTLKAVYSVVLMLLEIPTGYFADVAGRRTSILIGSVLGFGGYLIYSTSAGFWQFVVAEVVLGAGMSLVSGADSAMLYDSLKASGKHTSFTRYEGRITSFGNFSEAFAGIAGGLLAASSLILPFIVQTGVSFLAIPAALFLFEPPAQAKRVKAPVDDIIAVIKKVFVNDRRLLWNTLFSSITGVSTLTMAWFAQPWMISQQIPVAWLGMAWAVLNLTAGMMAMFAWNVERYAGMHRTVVFFTAVMLLCWFGLALTDFLPERKGLMPVVVTGSVVLLVFYSGRGLATPTLRNYIHIITTSDIRATVLSIRNFIIRGLFAITGPFFGWVTDRVGLGFALFMAGIIFGTGLIITMVYFLKSNRNLTAEAGNP
jgi:MFS family permease